MKKLSLMFFMVLFAMSFALAQRTVVGMVTDDSGDALIGATVLVKGTSEGTVTDLDGKYSVTVPSGSNTLVFSYTGFETQEIELGASNVVNVSLLAGISLTDVVVVGYGEQSNRLKVQSVSQVTEENIKNVPFVTPQQVLQGQAAGVQIVNSSGVLGSAAAIRIRGVASLNAGGSPLFVVDGVPMNDGAYTNELGASTPLNPLADIDPNDIESVSVLKDAAAAAIYGSRGSNGVVLITTKKGKAGSNRVNLGYYTGWVEPTNVLEMMNAEQYRTFMADYNGVSTIPATSFNWPDAVLQTGRINNYNLSFSGGTAKTQYYIGGTMLDQSNYTIGNELNKLTGRLNFKHSMDNGFRFGANIGLARSINDRINTDNSTFAPLTSAYLQFPYVEAYNEDGTFKRSPNFIPNILAIEELSVFELVSRRSYGNVFASYDLIPEKLYIKTDWGMDQVSTEETNRDPDIVSPGGYGYRRIISDIKWLTTNTLNYTESFGANNLSAVLGVSYETSELQRTAVEGSDFAADGLRNIASAATPTLTFADRTRWALASQFLRVNYNYNEKYLLEASIRRDGSSRFGANNRWGTFWAVAGGWIMSEESFMSDVDAISTLKLTASYGISGNDRIDNFASRGLYQSGVESDYAGNPGLRPTQAQNPDLKWEETSQLDLGIEIGVLNDRLKLSANYYIKNTTDLLLEFNLPDVGGISNISRNAGEMKNTGVDLDLNASIIRKRDFNWDLRLNMGFLNNEITALPEAALDEQGRQFISGTGNQRAVVGFTANEYYLIPYNGINPETGNAEWLDQDGNPTTNPLASARVLAGSAVPDFIGGFTNTLRYKDFDFNAFFNFTYGNEVLLGELRFVDDVRATGFNKSVDVLNYWTGPGDTDAFAPGPDSPTKATFRQPSTLQMQDGSFLRLRNISLGYTLKGKKLGTDAFESIRIYVMGQNMWTLMNKDFRGADPEVADGGNNNLRQGESFFSPPQARTTTVGVNVSF
ncbi:MAG: SusC/RagA family TonB-linked outer membrane protein [Saprospiraceae bacterium]